jgi:hypothetical protein
MRNNKHTSMLVSRECIPLLRFEISRNETSFSIEFFYVPNTMKILHGCTQSQLKQVTFTNNCIQSYSLVLKSLSGKNKHVPYSDSIFTKILKPFLQPKKGKVIMLNHLINDSKYEEIIFECVVLSKLLRSINKIHGSNEQEIDSQKSVAKAENFFTKHSKF